MRKWLFRLFWIPVLLIVVLFLVANRQMIAISLDPFSADNPALTSPALPLWLWLIFMVFIGVALGAAGMWLSAGEGRAKARAEHRELKSLRRELSALKAERARGEAREREDPASAPRLLESADIE